VQVHQPAWSHVSHYNRHRRYSAYYDTIHLRASLRQRHNLHCPVRRHRIHFAHSALTSQMILICTMSLHGMTRHIWNVNLPILMSCSRLYNFIFIFYTVSRCFANTCVFQRYCVYDVLHFSFMYIRVRRARMCVILRYLGRV
jgi:hypothetical protein